MRHITTFGSRTNRIYDGGPIMLLYYIYYIILYYIILYYIILYCIILYYIILYYIILYYIYYILMGSPSYMRSVVDRNVGMRRMTVVGCVYRPTGHI